MKGGRPGGLTDRQIALSSAGCREGMTDIPLGLISGLQAGGACKPDALGPTGYKYMHESHRFQLFSRRLGFVNEYS